MKQAKTELPVKNC